MSRGESDTEDRAAPAYEEKVATCQDCDREWTGSGAEALGATHSGRYDHQVKFTRYVRFDGQTADE